MMNRILTMTTGAALLLAGSAFGQAAATDKPAAQAPAPAAQAPAPAATTGAPTRVAIVNIQSAIGLCAEGKKAADDLTKRFTPKRNELEAKGALIQQKQKQMQDGEKVMNDEQKAGLAREIDRLTKDFNRDNDDANADYQQAMEAAINAIGGRMIQVISVYAQRNGYDLVLNSSNAGEVLWAVNRVDITDEVVGAFNMTNFTAAPAGGAAAPTTPSKPPATRPVTPPSTKPPATKPPQK